MAHPTVDSTVASITMKSKHASCCIGLALSVMLLLASCKTEDPSVLGEARKALAEAYARNKMLEEEVTSLHEELEKTRHEADMATEAKSLSANEIRSRLTDAETQLKEKVLLDDPGAVEEGYSRWDLKIPSLEQSTTCKVSMVIRDSTGKLKTLFWLGSADSKGNWSFAPVEYLSPPGTLAAQVDGPPVDPVRQQELAPQEDTAGSHVPVEPASKPRPRFDIPLDNPIMGPGAR